MSNPFTEALDAVTPPYWIREDDVAAMAEHLERLRRLGYLHAQSPGSWLAKKGAA